MASALSSKQRREYDSTLFSLINKEYACYSYNPRLYEQGERLAASLVPSSVRAELSDVVGRVLLPEQTLEINDFLWYIKYELLFVFFLWKFVWKRIMHELSDCLEEYFFCHFSF